SAVPGEKRLGAARQRNLGDAQLCKRRAGLAAARIRDDMELEYEDAGKHHDVVLRFSRRPRRAEIPLLAHDLAEARAVGGPAQREFLPALVLRFLEVEADALQELRLVEAQPQRLRTGCGRVPAARAAQQRLLDRMRRVL